METFFTNQKARKSANTIEIRIINTVDTQDKNEFNELMKELQWLMEQGYCTSKEYNFLSDWDLLNEIYS